MIPIAGVSLIRGRNLMIHLVALWMSRIEIARILIAKLRMGLVVALTADSAFHWAAGVIVCSPVVGIGAFSVIVVREAVVIVVPLLQKPIAIANLRMRLAVALDAHSAFR
jgi:hypothetical protein